MKIISNISLDQFDFRQGAKDNVNELTGDEIKYLEYVLEDLFPEGLEDVKLNDIFWFDFEYLVSLLGYDNLEEFYKERE